jgi:hypothetical protein
MQRVLGIVGGLGFGALCTSFGLIDTGSGTIQVTGGNEWTPVVTGAGALAGAAVGATWFFRRHVFSFLLAGLGLLTAIVLRDHYGLQPPMVFFDLLGLPMAGVLFGTRIDGWRARTDPSPAVAVLAGFAAVLAVAVVVVTVRGPDVGGSDNCETREGATFCKLFRE